MIQIKTLKELYNSVKANLEAELNVQIPVFGKTFLIALSAVTAAKLKVFYLAIAFLQKNIFVDTADPENLGGTLERWGRIKLGRNPQGAIQGKYEVQITGELGYIIPASTTFKSDDDSLSPGYLFILDEPFEITAIPDIMTLRALTGGKESQLQIGDTLTATNPLAQANEQVISTSEVTEPVDAESLELYRQRTIDSFRLEPQGGAGTDYRLWSTDANGVSQVYPYAKSGDSNVVEVFVEATKDQSTDGMGTPSTSILNDVRDVIEFNPDTTLPIFDRGRRPLGVLDVEVKAVNVSIVEITINNATLTSSEETLIVNSIISYIDSIRPKVDSIKVDVDDEIRLNRIIFSIEEAVKNADYDSVEFSVNSVAVPFSYVLSMGEIPFIDESLITFA